MASPHYRSRNAFLDGNISSPLDVLKLVSFPSWRRLISAWLDGVGRSRIQVSVFRTGSLWGSQLRGSLIFRSLPSCLCRNKPEIWSTSSLLYFLLSCLIDFVMITAGRKWGGLSLDFTFTLMQFFSLLWFPSLIRLFSFMVFSNFSLFHT